MKTKIMKAEPKTREITIKLTERQYKMVEDICGPYRLKPEELALEGLVASLDFNEEFILGTLQNAVDAEQNGEHHAWKGIAEKIKKENAA